MRKLIYVLLALLLAMPASAWTARKVASGQNGSVTYALCDAETTAADVCDNSDGVDLGANAMGYSSLVFYASGTGTFECTLYGGAYDVLSETSLSGLGFQIGGAVMNNNSAPLGIANAAFAAVWAVCGTIGTDVSIYLQMEK